MGRRGRLELSIFSWPGGLRPQMELKAKAQCQVNLVDRFGSGSELRRADRLGATGPASNASRMHRKLAYPLTVAATNNNYF
jgi:hypothetical protein